MSWRDSVRGYVGVKRIGGLEVQGWLDEGIVKVCDYADVSPASDRPHLS